MAEEGAPAVPDGTSPKFDLSWMNRSGDADGVDGAAPFVELCNSSEAEAEQAMQRLIDAGIECQRGEDNEEILDRGRQSTRRATLLVREDVLELARECFAGADTPHDQEDEDVTKAEDE